jgi:hypothetical protein
MNRNQVKLECLAKERNGTENGDGCEKATNPSRHENQGSKTE